MKLTKWPGIVLRYLAASPRLGDYSGTRDNNFNLIRCIAAIMVVFGHSFYLTLGQDAPEPLRQLIGIDSGSFAVSVFFVVSGFLVTGSLVRSGGLVTYLRSRYLRIFPGLYVMLLFTVFVVGPLFTTLPLAGYFTSGATWRYGAVNALLIGRLVQLEYALPGVFAGNPAQAAVNGSLWTLPYEIWLYVGLAFIWVAGLLRTPRRFTAVFAALLGLSILAVLGPVKVSHTTLSNFLRFGLFFFSGAALYVNRDRIPLSGGVAALLLLLAALFWKTSFGQNTLFAIALAYAVMWLAYVPAGPLRAYNRLGDYSYGTYIYAFPVQQAIAALWGDIRPLPMFCLATAVTLVLAILSWHMVEKRAMSLKSRKTAPLPADVPFIRLDGQKEKQTIHVS